VVKQNVLTGTVTVRTEEHREVIVRGEEIRLDQVMEKPKKPAPKEQPEAAQPQQKNRQTRDQRPAQKPQNRRNDRKGEGRGPKEKS
jgi:hypothetical protein